MTDTITVQGIYAGAIVADFTAGLAWYTRFMGRPADDQPFPGMAQWRRMGAAGLQLWQDDARAGKAILTIVVPDLAREQARLAAAGLPIGEIVTGGFGGIAQLTDPEGNRIHLAEPPRDFVNE
jgi:predicted enzyme related to lactoylglutathione lyase